jgi:hypothetical protein
MRPKKKAWTLEENERLKAIVAKWVSPARGIGLAQAQSGLLSEDNPFKIETPFPTLRQIRGTPKCRLIEAGEYLDSGAER